MRTSRIALAVALVLLLSAAACGDDETPPTTRAEEPGDGDGGGGGGGGDQDGGEPPSSLEFVAVDIDFERDEVEAAAGELEVALVNSGAIEHSWVVDGHEDELRLYTEGSGATDQGTLTLGAGNYSYYCDIPGHRAAGMEGTLTLR